MNQEKDQQIQSLQNKIRELEQKLEDYSQGGIKILFSGKANAQRVARKVKPRTLKEIPELSLGSEEEKSKNLVIEGDNLLVMATLYQYHGKIDLIIADPPYNTGKDFRYNDKWDEDPNDPGLGDYVKADDPSRHTKWMKFMLPRLQMIRQMLKNSGVFAICIDERELFRLGMMLDEVFGENNKLAIINWQKAYAPKSQSKHISSATEYVLVYAKNKEKGKTGRLERTELIDTIIASRIDKYQQKYQGLQVLKDQKHSYLIAKNANNEGFFLVWNGPNQNANFTKEVYEKIVQEAKNNNLKTPYHVYARLYLCQVDTVNFYQIPDSILLDFGFDLEKDGFN